MKRLHAYILVFLLSCQPLIAGGETFLSRFHPGIEWGFSPSLASYHHFNYLDESIGFRIDDEGWTYPDCMNAFFLASISFDLGRKTGLSLLSGYHGVDKDRRMVPLLLRTDIYPKGKDRDGFILFSDLGVSLRSKQISSNQFQLGSGYSIVLTPHSSLVFRLGARIVYDTPDVWDPIEEEYISARNIKRNDAWYYALNIGVGLYF